MRVPHQLMKASCQFCGRRLRYAKIPNRGPVMAHGPGEGERCRWLREVRRDIVSERERLAALAAAKALVPTP